MPRRRHICANSCAQRPHPADEVGDDRRHQEPSTIAPDPEQRPSQPLRSRHPLLDGHRQDQRRLLVRLRPQRTAYGGDMRSRTRDAGRLEVVGTQPARLSYVDSRRPAHQHAAGHRHPDDGLVVVLEPARDQGRRAVEAPPWTGLEDGRPVLSEHRQRAGVHRDALRVDRPPASGLQVGEHLVVRDAEPAELVARHDATLWLGETAHDGEPPGPLLATPW
jgi:hypothetical protein